MSTIRKGGSLPVTVQLLKELNGRITGDGDFRVKGVKVGKFSNLMHSSRVPHLVEHQINHYSNLEDPTLFDLQKLHVDLLLIHPFSDGNGRTVRMFASALALNLGYKSSLFVAFEQHFDHDPPAYNRLFNELRSSKIDKQCVALKLLRAVYENTKYIAWFRLKYRSLQQQGLNEIEISQKLHSIVDKNLSFEQQKQLNYQLRRTLSEEDESHEFSHNQQLC
ncbi:MAG: Fic family protein [Cyclobacteriaceae bacterium]